MNEISTVYVTQFGYQQLLLKLAEKEREYQQVCEHRQVAFELSGDGWHDNPEFNRMQQMEANLNHTIKSITDRLNALKLVEIDDAMRNLQQVKLGSIVRLRRYDLVEDTEADEVWEIRGYDETNINAQQLAYNAPLAAHILDLHVGDIAEEVAIGTKQFDIEVIALFANRHSAGLSV